MTPPKSFWEVDRTTINAKTNWYIKLPQLQRITYVLMLVFVICWCFYLGMCYAVAITPGYQGEILDGSDWPSSMEEPPPTIELEGMEVILLVGVDRNPDGSSGRTDTIMLAFLDWDTNEVKLLSIPRDSYVQLTGKSTETKINEAYYYGGVTLLQNTLEYTFGIEIDHYVEIDFTGFVKIIDILGGVEIDVPQDMKNLNEGIDLIKGLQTLDGINALGFVRFREKNMADIGRIERQQLFLRVMANKISASLPSLLPKIPQLLAAILDNCTTDYTFNQLLRLSTPISKVDLANVKTYSLQGRGIYIKHGSLWINFWVLDEAQCKSTIEEIIGEQTVKLHIINDRGAGLDKPPSNQVQKEIDEEEEILSIPDIGKEIPTDVAADNVIDEIDNLEPEINEDEELILEIPDSPVL